MLKYMQWKVIYFKYWSSQIYSTATLLLTFYDGKKKKNDRFYIFWYMHNKTFYELFILSFWLFIFLKLFFSNWLNYFYFITITFQSTSKVYSMTNLWYESTKRHFSDFYIYTQRNVDNIASKKGIPVQNFFQTISKLSRNRPRKQIRSLILGKPRRREV